MLFLSPRAVLSLAGVIFTLFYGVFIGRLFAGSEQLRDRLGWTACVVAIPITLLFGVIWRPFPQFLYACMTAVLLFLPVIGRSLRFALENGFSVVTVTLFGLAFSSVIQFDHF